MKKKTVIKKEPVTIIGFFPTYFYKRWKLHIKKQLKNQKN